MLRRTRVSNLRNLDANLIIMDQNYMSDIKSRIAEQELLITVCTDDTLLESLRADLTTLKRLDAEATGEAVSEYADGDDLTRSVAKLQADRGKAELRYVDKLAFRGRDEEFKRTQNPDYSWDDDVLRLDDVKLLARYEAELKTADSKLIEIQGAATFRVGYVENDILDACFSPALMPVMSYSSIYEMITEEEAVSEVNSFGELAAMVAKDCSLDKFLDLIEPIFKLAQKQASMNKAKSDKFLVELRKTPFDVFCKRLDRIMIRVAKKAGMTLNDQEIPSIEGLREAIKTSESFAHAIEAIDLDKERRECGLTWDDAIMPVVNFLVTAEIISVSTADVKSGLDLKELEFLYMKMNVRLAHETDFFVEHANPEYRAWAADFNVFRKEKEKIRLLINSLRAGNAKRAGSPVRKPIVR